MIMEVLWLMSLMHEAHHEPLMSLHRHVSYGHGSWATGHLLTASAHIHVVSFYRRLSKPNGRNLACSFSATSTIGTNLVTGHGISDAQWAPIAGSHAHGALTCSLDFHESLNCTFCINHLLSINCVSCANSSTHLYCQGG